MPLMQFCPNCWEVNAMEATACEQCGTSFTPNKPVLYDQKLLRALHHPVPDTREMAARLLGQRRDRHALPVLMTRLFEETDIGVLCAISYALGQLGNGLAVAALAKRLAQSNALVVTLTIIETLAVLAGSGCWEALDVLRSPPAVSERAAREIAARLATLNLMYY